MVSPDPSRLNALASVWNALACARNTLARVRNTLAGVMGVTLWLLTGSLAAQTAPEVYPAQVIVLADWGMSDASEIGYLHVGVLHRSERDALAVYDVRHRAPVVEWPSEPQHRTPPLDGDVFLVGHFDKGNTNRLGGYFNGFARAPSMSAIAIARAPDDGPALAYSYDKAVGSFAGFWIHLFDFKRPPAERVLFDASPFAYLTFAIRGEQGGRTWRCTSLIARGRSEKDRYQSLTLRRSSLVGASRRLGSARGFPSMVGLPHWTRKNWPA